MSDSGQGTNSAINVTADPERQAVTDGRSLEGALRDAVQKVARYVEDALEMEVVTKYATVGPDGDRDFAAAKPVALTRFKADGDIEVVVPARESEPGSVQLDINDALLELHERNVAAAIEYRAKLFHAAVAAVEALPSRLRRRGV